MATNQTHANADRQAHPLLDNLREMQAAPQTGAYLRTA